ncbi:MAG: HEAT repeat domain-containing protein [Proteobacteria bacterium]|nr:HEAT repeat domain-containing protein [Pseudomonadota bacterium]
MFPACSSAQPGDTPVSESHDSTTTGEKFQLKRRPSYVSPQVWARQKLAAAFKHAREPAPGLTRTFFVLPGEEDTAFSIGTTRDGYMINGRSLPVPSLLIRQLPVPYERGLTYGTQELIRLLVDTARVMEKKYPGTIMYMGNMGAREGGDISYSVSHNAGRDADIAFYLLDDQGKFAHPRHLHKINRVLHSREAGAVYTFDLEKNTTLVETLLTHPKINVQFIFLVKHLRSAIRKEFVNRGASEELLARFDAVVQVQAAHNDHFHVRIYCSDADICAGCVDKSLIHEWQEDPLPKRDKCVERHLSALSSGKSDGLHKAAALQRLALMDAVKDHLKKVLSVLDDEDPRVRMAAAFAAESLTGGVSDALAGRLAIEQDPDVRDALIHALMRHEDDAVRRAFNAELDRIPDEGAIPDGQARELRLILQYIAHHPHADYAAKLVQHLPQSGRDEMFAQIVGALEIIFNRHVCRDIARGACFEKIILWYEGHKAQTRQAWLLAGFRNAGYDVKNMDNADIPKLLDAVSGPRPVSVNAQIALKNLSKGKLEQNSLAWEIPDAVWYYTRYYKRNAKKYRIDLSDRDEKGNPVEKPAKKGKKK